MLRLAFPTFLALSSASVFAANSNPTFIGLGKPGLSGIFGNVVTIYKDAKDGQPKCLGCFNVRVVYDGYHGRVGASVVNRVAVNTDPACGAYGETTEPVKLNGLFRFPGTPTSHGEPLLVNIEPNNCNGTMVDLEFFAPKCQNPMSAACDELVLVEKYRFDAAKLGKLKSVSDTLPNKIN